MVNTLTVPAQMSAAPDWQNFSRDLVVGNTGDDVAAAQGLLQTFGMQIDEEELKAKKYGESTQRAAQNFIQQSAGNPILEIFMNFFCQLFFHMDADEFLHPETSLGAPHASRRVRTPSNTAEADAIEAVMTGPNKGLSGVANLANSYVGIRESGENQGAAVRKFCGYEGDPWCGGFVKHVMQKAIPGVYDQSNFMAAISFKQEADEHGAFRKPQSGYTPNVGDAVVFTRKGGNHVGIVTDVSNGKVNYVAGNDGDSVRARSFDLDSPPQSLIGYSDTQALAVAKGININKVQDTQLNANISTANRGPAVPHSDKDFARG